MNGQSDVPDALSLRNGAGTDWGDPTDGVKEVKLVAISTLSSELLHGTLFD
jgi:hypothetical protein